jgi:hypothetical protein
VVVVAQVQLAQIQMELMAVLVVLGHHHQLPEHLLKRLVVAAAVLAQFQAVERQRAVAAQAVLMRVLEQMELQILVAVAVAKI